MIATRVLLRLVAVLSLMAACACAPQAQNSISPDQAHAALAAGPLTMLDVRTDAEWRAGHVRGAVHLPVDEVAARARAVLTDPDQPIVVYCKAGGRASRAADTLETLGYTNVRVIRNGGYADWAAAGYPVER